MAILKKGLKVIVTLKSGVDVRAKSEITKKLHMSSHQFAHRKIQGKKQRDEFLIHCDPLKFPVDS